MFTKTVAMDIFTFSLSTYTSETPNTPWFSSLTLIIMIAFVCEINSNLNSTNTNITNSYERYIKLKIKNNKSKQAHFVIKMLKDEEPSEVKLKLSYFHSASSFPLQYKTIAQSFDELAVQYPDYECYVFKGISKPLYVYIHFLLIS